MRKLLIWFFLLVFVCSVTGCGLKEKAEQKATEAVTEKILEKAGGDELKDVDIDGDKVTFKGEDGQEVSLGSSKWPDSGVAESIPEFKEGTVVGVMNSQDGAVISLENVKVDDFVQYLEGIKAAYNVDAFETNADGYISYVASNSEGVGVLLQYGSQEQSLSISISREAQ